mgnify:CR=1 FL=1
MLGFADFLSGGLGDGGFMRVSIMAAMKAQSLRKAIFNGVQRLCELHVAYKYGKVFLPEDQPWKITFNSVSTALEREERETLESSGTSPELLRGYWQPSIRILESRTSVHSFISSGQMF